MARKRHHVCQASEPVRHEVSVHLRTVSARANRHDGERALFVLENTLDELLDARDMQPHRDCREIYTPGGTRERVEQLGDETWTAKLDRRWHHPQLDSGAADAHRYGDMGVAQADVYD